MEAHRLLRVKGPYVGHLARSPIWYRNPLFSILARKHPAVWLLQEYGNQGAVTVELKDQTISVFI